MASPAPSQYVEIAVNVPQVTGLFHYHIPPELQGRLEIGHLVAVPFGRQIVQGVVLRRVETPEVPETRAVIELVDAGVVLTGGQITLARQMAEANLAPLADCIARMLPTGIARFADTLYSLNPEADNLPPVPLNELGAQLLALLRRRGPLRAGQLDAALPRQDWRPAANRLVQRGLLCRQSLLPAPRVHPKLVRTAQLACAPEAAMEALASLGRAGTAALERRQAMLRFLIREPEPVDVTWLYAESGGNAADLQALAERGLVALGDTQAWRDPLSEVDITPSQPPPLTPAQQVVWLAVQAEIQRSAEGLPTRPILLHGVTGSGKTEIYLQAVAETLASGRQAIVLVPEIALTPQTIRRFAGRFPGQVGVLHSRLSDGERYDTWRRARQGSLQVMVGPRSALFAPFERLGLIVVDESHDDSYYQADVQPHFHARETAIAYARLTGAVCVLGTATPDITTAYRASQGALLCLKLPDRILAHRQVVQAQLERMAAQAVRPAGEPDHFKPLEAEGQASLAETGALPPVRVLDMRQELKDGNRSIFSRALQAALGEVLGGGLQAILFLNRRGSATYVFCRDCGYTVTCPRCDLPLTYHAQLPQAGSPAARGPLLFCHHCAYTRSSPSVCPQCGSHNIRHYGAGTEKVEAEVQALFPKARTLRWDYETTRQKGAHELILGHFAAHRADVLIGTQMIAKGLDLPLVTLVGVVLADVGLSLPDYRAAERTFQTLAQVAGRAGRSPLGGEVILQTFQPEHFVIQAAARHDYEAFYQKELEDRRRLGYPPFTRLVRLEYRHTDARQAEQAARQMAAQVQAWLAAEDRRATQMAGPAPCFFGRLDREYRWQIVLRGPDPASLLRGRPLGDWRLEVNPASLL